MPDSCAIDLFESFRMVSLADSIFSLVKSLILTSSTHCGVHTGSDDKFATNYTTVTNSEGGILVHRMMARSLCGIPKLTKTINRIFCFRSSSAIENFSPYCEVIPAGNYHRTLPQKPDATIHLKKTLK